jgi:hypothetical protein
MTVATTAATATTRQTHQYDNKNNTTITQNNAKRTQVLTIVFLCE